MTWNNDLAENPMKRIKDYRDDSDTYACVDIIQGNYFR